MTWTVDRVENGIAVIELSGCGMINVPTSALPCGLQEGDILNVEIDKKGTDDRKRYIEKKMNSLFED